MKLRYPTLLLSALLALPAFAGSGAPGTPTNRGDDDSSTRTPGEPMQPAPERRPAGEATGDMPGDESVPPTRETRPRTDESDMRQPERSPSYDEEEEEEPGEPGTPAGSPAGSSGTYHRPPLPGDME